MTETYKEFRTDFSMPAFRFDGAPALRPMEGCGLDEAMAELAAQAVKLEDARARGACRQALDWLETLKQRLEKANRAYGAVHMAYATSVTATSDGVPVPGTEIPEAFAWNVSSISDDEAMDLVGRGMAEFDQRIVCMTQTQAEHLFPDRGPDPEGTEENDADQDQK